MAITGSAFLPRTAGLKVTELTPQERQQQAGMNEEPEVDRSPASQLARMVDMTDEMVAAMRAQFRRRADMQDKADSLGDSFERVLEENVVPKAMAVLKLAGQAGTDLQWLLQRATEQFPDPSDLVLVVRALLERGDMEPATRQRLEALLAAVVAQSNPKRLKAGINAALKARLYSKHFKLRATMLRTTYRSFLENDEGAVTAYEEWIALYGDEHRGHVLDFIEAALLTDSAALDPSCTRQEFGELMHRLGELKQLRSADLGFVHYVLAQPSVNTYNSREKDWLLFMLGLLRYPDELRQLLGDVLTQGLLLADARARGAALQCLRRACQALPPALFEDEKAPSRVAEQFTELASAAYPQERLAHHAALHRYPPSEPFSD